MNIHTTLRMAFGLSFVLAIGLAECARARLTAPAEPTPVSDSRPVKRYVTDYAVFTGWTAAVDSVEVRAPVRGFPDRANFQEGALVTTGDVLFEIEPQTYQAALDQAHGNARKIMIPIAPVGPTHRRAQRRPLTVAISWFIGRGNRSDLRNSME